MLYDNLTKSIINVETLIGNSDPDKGIAINPTQFKSLTISSNLFSIAPVCIARYEFTKNDEKPKIFDNLYIKIYKNLEDDEKGALLLSADLLILSMNLSTLSSTEGIIERYDFICVASSIYTLTNKMNLAYSNTNSIDVINNVLALKDNLSYQLEVDSEISAYDKMNWVFSQKTTLEILKKTLRHMQIGPNEKDIPLLFSYPDKRAKLTSLVSLCQKDPKCTITDTKTYNNIDAKDQKQYLQFYQNTIGKYQGGISLLSNGFGQMLYQYNPWADQDFGDGLFGMIMRGIQFVSDLVVEELKPLDPAFRHPDKVDDQIAYRAYESYNFSLGSIMPGTPIKPPNLNSNISTLKYVGINTKELHYMYNVMPHIYENIVRNFFSNSVDVLCYINGQNERFQKFEEFPKLGDCVVLSLNTEDEVEDVRNGKYLIGKYSMQFGDLHETPIIKYTLYKDTMNYERPRTEGEEE